MKSTRPSWAAVLGLAAALVLPGAARAQEAFDNVVIVLDASGSMRDKLSGTSMEKLAAAKEALKAVLRTLPESTHVGLLVFSAANVRDEWIYPLGPRRDAELTQAIDLPVAHGGTPLGFYLKKAADRLLEERARQFGYGTYRMLVVTDGEARDQPLVDRYTPEIIARGITLDVIGVNMQQDHTLAKRVHSYRRANDRAALNRALAEVLGEVSARGTDTAQADAFELLAPIPTEVAVSVLRALSSGDNQPIGTTRPAGPAPRVPPPSKPRPSASSPSAPATAPFTPPVSTPTRAHRQGGHSWLVWVIVGVFVVGFLKRAGRGGRP
jgi:uncharacterized protein YegL